MGNTPTPKPPLPFGGSPAEGPRDLFRDASGTLFRKISDVEAASVTDITNLVGARVFDSLTIRGEIGLPKSADAMTAVNRTRQPWVLTCQSWINEGRYIIASVNPKEVQWQLPQRSAQQKVRMGEILHIWKDRFRGTFYDEPQLSITFQSGNIMPIRQNPLIVDGKRRQRKQSVPSLVTRALQTQGAGINGPEVELRRALNDPAAQQQEIEVPRKVNDPDETEPVVPEGLDNFYRFLELVDEQKILDEEGQEGDVNFVYIIYNSRMFPNLTLAGLFTPAGVSWTDSSDDPNQINSWTAGFTIYDSYPRLNDYNALVKFFKDAGFGRR